MTRTVTVRSPRRRKLIAALVAALALAALGYFNISVDPELVEDVAEAAVDAALAPDEEPEPDL